MSELQTTEGSLKAMIGNPVTRAKFEEMLGNRTPGFFVSLTNAVNSNALLQKAEPKSILMAAAIAAALDLPIEPNLGFAYIVPYNTKIKGENGQKDTWKTVAQFQIGYKGINQLALRTGQYETINTTDVREGEIESEDLLTGEIRFKWLPRDERLKAKVIGYVSYFRLVNGFWKMLYMSNEELKGHAGKYSQTYIKGYGKWKDDFDSMSKKTVNKLIISRWGPMSIELKTALAADQAVIKGYDNGVVDTDYVDNTPPSLEEHQQQQQIDRIADHITNAATLDELEEVYPYVMDSGLTDMYTVKKDELSAKLKTK